METKDKWWEHSNIIDSQGILLDDNYNELRNDDGQIIIVPKKDRKYCIIVNRD